MRTTLLASAALLGLALAAPAFAQNDTALQGTSQGTPPPANPPAMGQSGDQVQPMPSAGMDNGGMTDQGAMPKPRMHTGARAALPADGSPQHYLSVAREALNRHRPREAEDALAFAETRLLDRSVPASAAGQPDDSPAIRAITDARDAIGKRDWQGAQQSIDRAMNSPGVMAATDSPTSGTMNGGNGTMPSSGTMGAGTSGNGSLPSGGQSGGAMSGGAQPSGTGTPSLGSPSPTTQPAGNASGGASQ